jgi:hypothetical protein
MAERMSAGLKGPAVAPKERPTGTGFTPGFKIRNVKFDLI